MCLGVTQSRREPGKWMHVQTDRREIIRLKVTSDVKPKWCGQEGTYDVTTGFSMGTFNTG